MDAAGHETKQHAADAAAQGEDDGVDADSPVLRRLYGRWHGHLDDRQQAAVLAWASFATTFGVTRAITHWIRDGHGPSGAG